MTRSRRVGCERYQYVVRTPKAKRRSSTSRSSTGAPVVGGVEEVGDPRRRRRGRRSRSRPSWRSRRGPAGPWSQSLRSCPDVRLPSGHRTRAGPQTRCGKLLVGHEVDPDQQRGADEDHGHHRHRVERQRGHALVSCARSDGDDARRPSTVAIASPGDGRDQIATSSSAPQSMIDRRRAGSCAHRREFGLRHGLRRSRRGTMSSGSTLRTPCWRATGRSRRSRG